MILVDLTAKYDTVLVPRALPWRYPWPSPCVVHLCYNLQPQLYTQGQTTDRSGRLCRLKMGSPGLRSWLRHYLTSTSSISLLPRHPSTHMQTTLHSIVQSRSSVSRSSSWKRLLLARLEPIIDPHLPDERAGFRRGRSTVHQIVNLTVDIEEAFETATRQAWILVDLTAKYDTVWHQGLTLTLSLTVTLCGSSLL